MSGADLAYAELLASAGLDQSVRNLDAARLNQIAASRHRDDPFATLTDSAPGQTPNRHAPAFGLYFPLGAVGDGVTSDSNAFAALIAGMPPGSTLVLEPNTTYAISNGIVFNNPIKILGQPSTKFKRLNGFAGSFFTFNTDDAIVDSCIFEDGDSTSNMLNFAGFSRGLVYKCTFINAHSVAVRFAITTDARIEDSFILGCGVGIQLESSCFGTRVVNNTISGWTTRGIYIIGTVGATTDTVIQNNTIKNMAAGGGSRYPITSSKGASPDPHKRMLLIGNTVLGAGKSYTAVDPGNADCFGMFAVEGLRIIGNLARDGGDMGITVDSQCKDVSIIGNTCVFNDTGGIAIANGATRVTVVGNICSNNGQNRNGDKSDIARTGIYAFGAIALEISGNTLGDDQGVKTQKYGVTMTSCTNVTLGPDTDAGNAIATYFKSGAANVSINKVTTAAF